MTAVRCAVGSMGSVLLATALVAQGTGWRANPDVVAKTSKGRAEFNYEEANVKPFELPDPLARADGGRVRTPGEWRARRGEILELFRANMYGRRPGTPKQLRFESLEENASAMGGRATLKRVAVVSRQEERDHRFELTIFLPNGAPGRVPLFLLINNRAATLTSPTRMEPSPFWPAEAVVARGYGIAALQNGDLAPDDKDRFREGVISLFEGPTTGERPPDAWAALAAWGWGLTRIAASKVLVGCAWLVRPIAKSTAPE